MALLVVVVKSTNCILAELRSKTVGCVSEHIHRREQIKGPTIQSNKHEKFAPIRSGVIALQP